MRVTCFRLLHASIGVPTVYDRGTSNVLRAARANNDNHPSPKPIGLMRELLEVVTKQGDLIVDPFSGEGNTLIAAYEAGRKVIGIEIEEAHCETTARRFEERLSVA